MAGIVNFGTRRPPEVLAFGIRGAMPIATVNPATGRTVKTFEAHSDRDVEDRIVRATRAAAKMREIPAQERARLVARLGDALTQRREELAKLMTLEMGK